MNAESLQIVEFWKRENFEWVRKPEYEIGFIPLSDKDIDPEKFSYDIEKIRKSMKNEEIKE